MTVPPHRDDKTLSVVIPAYNQALYLGEALSSVLRQTVADIEVIVVDDGSTDDTAITVAGFDDPRVRYLYQANRGLAGARNTGIAHATAPLLAFLDADDRLLPESLALHLSVLQEGGGIGMSVGGHTFIDAAGAPLGRSVLPPPSIAVTDLLMGSRFAPHSLVVRRSWLDEVGGFDERLKACEDWDCWLRLLIAGCPIRTMAKVVCCYRVHGDQMTQQADRMRTAGLATLDKLYGRTDLPDAIVDARPRAYARVRLDAAARCFRAGDVTTAFDDMDQAVRADPSLRDHAGRRLAVYLAGWADDLATRDAVTFLESIDRQLPPIWRWLRPELRRNIAQAWWRRALSHHQAGDSADAGRAAWSALRHDPGLAANRGLTAMILRGRATTIRRLLRSGV
jgi:glycosyltransferase involved in cell wall biosynthesis